MKTIKVRMNYTQVYNDSGRYLIAYAGLEYDLPEIEAKSFLKTGAANKIIKRGKNESGVKISNSSGKRTRTTSRRKNILAN